MSNDQMQQRIDKLPALSHDLDDVWKLMGYSSKQRAMGVLRKNFVFRNDYDVVQKVVHYPNNSSRVHKCFISTCALEFLTKYRTVKRR